MQRTTKTELRDIIVIKVDFLMDPKYDLVKNEWLYISGSSELDLDTLLLVLLNLCRACTSSRLVCPNLKVDSCNPTCRY